MSTTTQESETYTSRLNAELRKELRLALIRYERLSSMPRWMTVPYVSNIDGLERGIRHAIDTGNEERAKELQSWLDEEWRRRELAAQWGSDHDGIKLYLTPREQNDNWKGRTIEAWTELLIRMRQARANAVGAGVLDRASEGYRAVSDRICDVEHRIQVAKRREAQGEPAVA